MSGKKREKLRSGFTTGTAAAAAAKAAMEILFGTIVPVSVEVWLPTGDTLEVKVHRCVRPGECEAEATVVKDAGDDPDITHGAEIGAAVTWRQDSHEPQVAIRGGPGVGMVTKPGLEVPVGEPAINPVPREMIRRAVLDVLEKRGVKASVTVEIFVPEGEALARHTLNARLGIVGGISILGTTGIVKPLSHEAYVTTIDSALSVAKASGLSHVVFTTGRRSERFAQRLFPGYPDEAFVQMGDYFAKAMEMAANRQFGEVTLALFFGKAVKMAQAIPHTHARSAQLSLETLGRWAFEITHDEACARHVSEANTARHAFDLIVKACPELIERVGREVSKAALEFGGGRMRVETVIFGFDGQICFESVVRGGAGDGSIKSGSALG